jgi:hypothetical protein
MRDIGHHHHHRPHGMCCPPFFPGGMFCMPMNESKETAIKSLEAMKAHLQDYIKSIDEQIEELQKEKA